MGERGKDDGTREQEKKRRGVVKFLNAKLSQYTQYNDGCLCMSMEQISNNACVES